MPETTTRKAKSQSRADTLLPLQVRYYKRMYRGRTYPVEISWKPAERGVAAKPVTLRVESAGAIVVPTERILRPVDPDDSVKFFVTPLSLGRVGHFVIEMRQENNPFFEMPLKAKVGNQLLTLVLLLVAVFVPVMLIKYCVTPYEMDGLKPRESMIALIESYTPDLAGLNARLPAWLPVASWVQELTEAIGTGYSELCEACKSSPIPTYAGVTLLLLTLISAWWHRPKRKWRISEPISLPSQVSREPAN